MSYGVTTDYLHLGDTNWRPQSGACEPTAAGEAQALDSNGDIRASTVHGKAKAWKCGYKVVGGDSLGVFSVNAKAKLGAIIAVDSTTKGIVTGVAVETTNTAFPMVTYDAVEFFGDTSSQKAYTIPEVSSLKAAKQAQAMGMSVAGSNRLNSASLNATLQVVQEADSLGVFKQSAGYQGRAEATGEAVNESGAPALTVDSGWAVQRDQGVATQNTDYGKGTLAVFKNILPDT